MPDSTAFAQVTLMESHPQQAQTISPDSPRSRAKIFRILEAFDDADRESEDHFGDWGNADVALPGPRLPGFIGK